MDKLISHTIYWDDFIKRYPDGEPMRAFFAEDPVLTKIFNFAAVPCIFSSIENFPFDEKLIELSNMSQAEIKHLDRLDIYKLYDGKKKVSEWLGYLVNLYELVKLSIKFYEYFKKRGKLTNDELKKLTAGFFYKWFSIDEIWIYENSKGERYRVQKVGRISPDAWHIFRQIPDKVPRSVLQIHYHFKPSMAQITQDKNHLDTKSLINYRIDRPLLDSITYGGFHPQLDKSIVNPEKKEGEKYLVEFYYNGQKLDHFEYSIRKRYKNLLIKAAKGKDEYDIRDEHLRRAEAELLRIVEDFKESEARPPAVYFSESFKHIKEYIFKLESTENIEKVFEHEEFAPDGPVKKNVKRVRRKDLEQSGGIISIDGRIVNDEEIPKPSDPEEPDNPFKNLWPKDAIVKFKDLVCKDEIDAKIIDLWIDGTGRFENSDKINFLAIAKTLGTNDKNISRRWKKIIARAKKSNFKEILDK